MRKGTRERETEQRKWEWYKDMYIKYICFGFLSIECFFLVSLFLCVCVRRKSVLFPFFAEFFLLFTFLRANRYVFVIVVWKWMTRMGRGRRRRWCRRQQRWLSDGSMAAALPPLCFIFISHEYLPLTSLPLFYSLWWKNANLIFFSVLLFLFHYHYLNYQCHCK